MSQLRFCVVSRKRIIPFKLSSNAARGDTVHTAQLRLDVFQPTTGLIVQLTHAEADGRIVDVQVRDLNCSRPYLVR